MVYGELEFGSFDDEISGINLSKLFSVYGPQSAEGKRKKPGSKLEALRAAAQKHKQAPDPMLAAAKPALYPHVVPIMYYD